MALTRTNQVGQVAAEGSPGTSSYTTSSFTPPNNSLLVATFTAMQDNATGDFSASMTITDSAGLTWTSRVVAVETSIYSIIARVYTAPVTTGTSMTITVDCGAIDLWCAGVSCVAYTGYDVANPIGGTGTFSLSSSADGAHSLTLSSAPASSDEVFAVVGLDKESIGCTPGSAFTEQYDLQAGTSYGFEVETDTGTTSTTVDWVDLHTGTGSIFRAVAAALVIKADTGGGGGGGLTFSRLGSSTSYTTGTSLASSSVTVSEGDLIFVSVSVSGGATATASRSTANITTSLGGSWSWTLAQVAPALASSIATYVYRAQVPIGGGGTGTFTFTASASVTDSRVCVTKVTGHDTTTPIVGDTTLANTTSTSGSMTAGATPTTADALVGIISSRNDTNGMTVGTSFTSLSNEFDAATPSASQLIEYRKSTTSTTIDVSGMATTSNNGVGFIVKASSGSNYSGSPALSGSGSLSATQQSVDVTKSVSLSGSGSLGAVTGVTASGSASLSGSGALTAAIIPKFAAAPSFSGNGTLSAVPGPPNFKISPALSGSGILNTSATVQLIKAASLSGAGTLSISATLAVAITAALSGSGTLAVLSNNYFVSVGLSGSGILSVVSVKAGGVVSTALSGSGLLTALGIPKLNQVASLLGSGILTVTEPNVYTNFWYNGSVWIPITFYLKS